MLCHALSLQGNILREWLLAINFCEISRELVFTVLDINEDFQGFQIGRQGNAKLFSVLYEFGNFFKETISISAVLDFLDIRLYQIRIVDLKQLNLSQFLYVRFYKHLNFFS